MRHNNKPKLKSKLIYVGLMLIPIIFIWVQLKYQSVVKSQVLFIEPTPTLAVYPNIGHLEDETVGTKPSDKSQYTTAMVAEKEANFQHSLNRFLEKYPTANTPGLDTTWLDQVANTTADTPLATWTYGIIQFPHPFDLTTRQDLEIAGVKFYTYVGGGALKVALNHAALPTLNRLFEQGRILYGGPIPPATKIDPALQTIIDTTPATTTAVTIIFFEPPPPLQHAFIKTLVDQQGAYLHPPMPVIRGYVQATNLNTLSQLPIVAWLTPVKTHQPATFESRLTTGLDALRYNDPLDSTGASIVVGVLDSGIFQTPYHPALPEARIKDQRRYYPPLPGSSAAEEPTDPGYGHGTHVAGIIGGYESDPNTIHLQGYAPEADFVIYKMCCDENKSGFLFEDVQDSLAQGALYDMTVVNNSWGKGAEGVYDEYSELIDKAVRGEFGHPMHVVVAVGNVDVDVDEAMQSPATARNSITVGAIIDGSNPNDHASYWPPGYKIHYSKCGIVDFDNDGKTLLGLDLVTPGVMIHSTVPYTLAEKRYGPKQGTSQAAPAVSGAIAALLDHYSDSAPWLSERPDVVNALLFATATNLGIPKCYGHGLLDIFHAAYIEPNIVEPTHFWGSIITNTSHNRTFNLTIPEGYHTVRTFLTWSDPPLDPSNITDDIINDLDLIVYDNPDCSGIPIGTSVSADDNVEPVIIAAGEQGGDWCFKVDAFSLTESQLFGLAVSTILQPPSLSITLEAQPTRPISGQLFSLYSTVHNTGTTAAGTYIELDLPPQFSLEAVELFSTDGLSNVYTTSKVFTESLVHYDNGLWELATGNIIAYYPRKIRWSIKARGIPGQEYTLSTVMNNTIGQSDFRTSEFTTTVTINRGFYIPLIAK